MEIKFNAETLKIELHFEKCDYLALSDKQKSDLKSAFLWSNFGKCWVSRAKSPATYYAERIAESLGFDVKTLETVGEALTHGERQEQKAERAEARAERYDEIVESKERKAKAMQAEFNRFRGDWSFITQPIIAGHAGSQRFGRYRERIAERYRKGFDELGKAEYYTNRAEAARETAMRDTRNITYIHAQTRARELRNSIEWRANSLDKYIEYVERIEGGEVIALKDGETLTAEQAESRVNRLVQELKAFTSDYEHYNGIFEELKQAREDYKASDAYKAKKQAAKDKQLAHPFVVGQTFTFGVSDHLTATIERITPTGLTTLTIKHRTETDFKPYQKISRIRYWETWRNYVITLGHSVLTIDKII